MTAKERRDIADRAKYDGLTLQEVNALVRARRYVNGYQSRSFQKHQEKLVKEGYWDPTPKLDDVHPMLGGFTTDRGEKVVKIAYGEALQPVFDAYATIEARHARS